MDGSDCFGYAEVPLRGPARQAWLQSSPRRSHRSRDVYDVVESGVSFGMIPELSFPVLLQRERHWMATSTPRMLYLHLAFGVVLLFGSQEA